MSGEVLTYTLVLAAPEARVFAAVTEARHLARWFCDECESEPSSGGAVVMRWTRPGGSSQAFGARWVEWEPPERASFEGGHSGYPGGRAGVVRFVVEPVTGGGTALRIEHEIPSGDEYTALVSGWRSAWPRALDRFERYLAPGMAVERASASRFERYVALGDSSTEGLADGDEKSGYRGWSRRLAERIASAQGGLQYANLAQRGLTTREIRDRQLERALALAPDLATVFSGTNDVLAARFDVTAFAREVRAIQQPLRERGATVLTFTLPDLAPLIPLARLVSARITAMNDVLRAVSAETGSRLVDFAAYPVATDARLWHPDRIHANAAGHARIADALAEALELPGVNGRWREPLPEPARRNAFASLMSEAAWTARHLLPWCVAGLLAGGRRPVLHLGPEPALRELSAAALPRSDS